MLTGKEAVSRVLKRQDPGRFVYAPNYWQWFAHQVNHDLIIPDMGPAGSQLKLIRHLGLDVFSRNIYSDPRVHWFGGLTEPVWDGVEFNEKKAADGRDTVITRSYRAPSGTLSERLRYIHRESTLVQEEFLIKDFEHDFPVYRDLLSRKSYRFQRDAWERECARTGEAGVVVAGEVYSPLKLLHLYLGSVDTTFAVTDHPEKVKELLGIHEKAMLEVVEAMAAAGVPVIMSMDNLDTMFHPPHYVERYSASFYEKASARCHAHGSAFFIHACGQQKANLKLIAGLGVDGLEGVAYPPLGDVTLDEAMRLTGDRFIVTGGISAMETRDLQSRAEVFDYVKELLTRMRPYRHRFMLSASCNTSIDTSWETILHFRDAWSEYREL